MKSCEMGKEFSREKKKKWRRKKESFEQRILYYYNKVVYIKYEYCQSLRKIILIFWFLLRSVVNLNKIF